MKQLFCDCKTDEEKSNFFLSGRAVESGVIAPALVNDVAMAYHRCAEFQKEIDALRAKITEMEKQAPFDADSDVFRSAFEAALKAGNWPATRQGDGYRSPSTQIAWRVAFSTVNRLKLYLAPGAQPAPGISPTGDARALSDRAKRLVRLIAGTHRGNIETHRELYALIDSLAVAVDSPPSGPAPSVPEGWQLVPTAESRHPGIYKMLGALHAADNTPGMSEWESYRAMLSEAPEAKS